ncbi:MAG TPA: DUF4126 domain-containing protein [Acidobacteria bacterium]|nr:DUF4126 domain-containing protein [Acidobacteriota bacterium]
MSTVAAVLGLASAAGINAYATLFVLGLAVRLHVVDFQSHAARFFASTPALIVLGILYLLEFFADKIPAVDHVWDAIHTFIRPVAGAAAAIAVVGGHANEGWVIVAALVAGTTSLLFHGAKATGRLAVSATTLGTGNWFVSLIEDAIAITGSILALVVPVAALFFVLVLLLLALWFWRSRRAAAH